MISEDLKLISPGEVRVRIAPSPTGPLHIGTARTALFNYLFAQKHQGSFILRIEDTDKERSEKKWEENIIEGLRWLGIDWAEGPDIGGDYGPYRQSEKRSVYTKYLKQLIEEDKAYYCFCSKEDLEAQRQYQMSIGKTPIYTGKCRDLSKETVAKYLKEKKPFVIRLKNPMKKVSFDDMVRGNIEFDSTLLGDFVLARDFDSPLYNFAVVVDDEEMAISHVIRGEDHISNTPKQILIQEALGFNIPRYAHLPLILGPDKTKLSKRHGATSIIDYQKEGYLAEALVNFIALLSWNPGNDKEIFSLTNLTKSFSMEKIQKSGAVFNIRKLEWMNGFYIRQKSLENLTNRSISYLSDKNMIKPVIDSQGLSGETYEIIKTGEIINFNYLKRIISLYQERMKKLSEIPELAHFFFERDLDYNKELLKWKDMTERETKKALKRLIDIISKIKPEEWNRENITELLTQESDKTGDRGKLLWPMRVALTGEKASAGPFDVATILGKEKTLERITKAYEAIQ
jgi:nondiscriminating glutamyl-tRNA synthetase